MTTVNKQTQKSPTSGSQIESTGLPCILKPGKFEIFDGGSFYGIVALKHTTAYRLNRVLQQYRPDVVFTAKDEPIFKVKKSFGAMKAVKNALGIKG